MAQSIEELVALGLSKAEAERVINRKVKAEQKSGSAKATAEKRLPKIQEDLDHAAGRVAHWQTKAAELQAKVDKYVAIISDTEPAKADDGAEPAEPVKLDAKRASKAAGKK